MKAFIVIGYVLFIGLCITNIKALTDEEKRIFADKVYSVTYECMQDYPLTLADLLSFKKKIHPGGEIAKCFSACLFKKVGMMDEMGMFSIEGARMNAEQVIEGKENGAYMQNVDGLLNYCAQVNEVIISDGARGCDRALLIHNCLSENGPKFGFDPETS